MASSRSLMKTATFAVVFNGELFDYVERRDELRARGHRFVTHLHTEIILICGRDHGDEMWERLRGQFAIALMGPAPAGNFNLGAIGSGSRRFFGRGKMIGCCSPPKSKDCSRRHGSHPGQIVEGSIMSSLSQQWPGPRTCFEGVQLLTSGHCLKISPSSGNGSGPLVEERAFWKMDFPDQGSEERGETRSGSLTTSKGFCCKRSRSGCAPMCQLALIFPVASTRA